MEIGSGRLAFTPEIEPLQVGPSALDLRLGNEFTTFKPPEPGVETIIDLAKVGNVENALLAYGESRTLSNDDSFILRPGQFVLTYTLEYIKMPDYLAARVEGRSSLARLGVSIHQTAPTVHATFEGQLRLEISHNGPYSCRLRPGQRICQLIIERLGSPSQSSLNSLFQHQGQQ
jgi:dCTP deaminase